MDDIPELRDLFLGDAGIQPSLANFWLFCTRCYEIIGATWAAEHNCPDGSCPQGSPEREAGKQRFTNLVRENMWIASLLGALYVLFVTFVPRMIKKPLPLGRVLQLWNLSLAVFSAFGAYHCFGALWANLGDYGFRYTVCQLPKKIDMHGYDLDIWVSFFVLSKILEMFDTVLKVLLMKKFLFLHWYHHLMTAWLGWLSLAYDAAPGQWYAGINFVVHTPMYTYFFLSSVLSKDSFNRYCRPIAPIITTVQIVQMVVYVVVNSMATYYKVWSAEEGGCNVHHLNITLNAVVTLSYLFLFSTFFVDKYLRSGGDSKAGQPRRRSKKVE